jgi:hypothetical protein
VKRFIEEGIPTYRLVLYAVASSLLVVMMAILYANSEVSSAEEARDSLRLLGDKIQRKSALQEPNRAVIHKFREKDPLFLHKTLEPLALVGSETAILKARLARSALPDDNALEKRLHVLTAENVFCFVEGSTEVAATWKETVENQNKLVEVDSDDLAKVLTILEPQDDQEDPSKPHLLISEIRLDRRKGMFQETWGLMLKVIRREYQ